MDQTKTEDKYRLEAELLWMRIMLRAFEHFTNGNPQTIGVALDNAELITYTN